MYIMGIDPALTTSGVVLIDVDPDKPPQVMLASTIKTNAKDTTAARVAQVAAQVAVMVEENPELIVVELPFLNKGRKSNPATYAKQNRVIGALDYVCRRHKVVYVEPTAWQTLYLTGIAGNTKQASMARFALEFGRDAASDHIADAGLLALWGWHQVRVNEMIQKQAS